MNNELSYLDEHDDDYQHEIDCIYIRMDFIGTLRRLNLFDGFEYKVTE